MDIYKSLLPPFISWVVENRIPLGHAFSGGAMAILRCIYQEDSIRKTLAEGCMCAFAAFGISEIIIVMAWETELALPAAVFLGYIGIAPIIQILQSRLGIRK